MTQIREEAGEPLSSIIVMIFIIFSPARVLIIFNIFMAILCIEQDTLLYTSLEMIRKLYYIQSEQSNLRFHISGLSDIEKVSASLTD